MKYTVETSLGKGEERESLGEKQSLGQSPLEAAPSQTAGPAGSSWWDAVLASSGQASPDQRWRRSVKVVFSMR